tara:strand:- start:2186 stop:2953 length:768 start_codon:yes stop_codon:yes gene_type:complete
MCEGKITNLLVLLRHGESLWNLENRFTGWTDIGLTKKGILEAKSSGRILKKHNIKFDLVYTSVLERAKHTMRLCLSEMNLYNNIPIKYDWRLNERHYGQLQGLNKADVAREYGDEKVHIWRRSYNIPPPPLSLDDKRNPRFDEKYKNVKFSEIPKSESLKDTFERFIPLWNNEISKNIKLGKKVLIVAHGNSLRALVKYIDNISNSNIVKLNIPTGIPLIYNLNKKLKPISNYYLGNQEEIGEKIALVKNQTKQM